MDKLIAELKKVKEISAPEWAPFVKTGASKERPPQNPEWWVVRSASLLNKINNYGPIGTNRLSKAYGSRKNRGVKPEKKYNGSRNIIRKCIQQLEAAKLIKQVDTPRAGKMVTKEGREMLKRCDL
jgi:small subunit ribosomal protein S19e